METIYLQDNSPPVIKLEPLEPIDIDSGERTKVGVIFQTSPYLLEFVCAHCSAEFSVFSLFTSHIETHLHQIHLNRIKVETLPSEMGDNLGEINAEQTTRTGVVEWQICEPATMNDVNVISDARESVHAEGSNGHPMERSMQLNPTVRSRNPKELPKKSKTYECFECHRKFDHRTACQRHMRNHLVTACQYCSQPTRTLNSVRLHRRLCRPITAADVPAECFVCLRKFPSYRYYYMHAREEHGLSTVEINKRRKTVCKRCSLDLKTPLEYQKHKQWHKTRKSSEHKCEVCDKVFPSYNSSNYKYHMQQHSGEKSVFFCDICQKEYALSYKMEHMRLHAGERRHQCSQCGVLCLTAARLRRHMKRHTTERPFECVHCNKRFRSDRTLDAHRRLHTGEFIHYCALCEKGYTNKVGLEKHVERVHGPAPLNEDITVSPVDESRPFQCDSCKKRFRTPRNLKEHKRLHTGKFVHYCEPCKKGYTNRAGLRQHLQKVHGPAAPPIEPNAAR